MRAYGQLECLTIVEEIPTAVTLSISEVGLLEEIVHDCAASD